MKFINACRFTAGKMTYILFLRGQISRLLIILSSQMTSKSDKHKIIHLNAFHVSVIMKLSHYAYCVQGYYEQQICV